MPSISDAVARIQAADLPVLFADTCILLDVIRAPLRPAELRGCVSAAQELLQLTGATPTQCIVVVASFVPGEWLAHSQPEADSLRAHLAKFDGEAERLREFCSLMKIVPPFARTEYGLLPLAERLHNLSRQLLDCALHLDSDHDCIIRAHGRATSYTPPSLKGGEVKDSTIIEECLEVSRRLEAWTDSPGSECSAHLTGETIATWGRTHILPWPSISGRSAWDSRPACRGP